MHRAARQAQPTYAALCTTVRGSPVVTPDETGWKVGGHPARMLGADYGGVIHTQGTDRNPARTDPR